MKNVTTYLYIVILYIISTYGVCAQMQSSSNANAFILRGIVLDEQTKKPIKDPVDIQLINNDKDKLIESKATNSDGYFEFEIKNLRINYILGVSSKDYNSYFSDIINLKGQKSPFILKEILLTKFKSTDVITPPKPDVVYITIHDTIYRTKIETVYVPKIVIEYVHDTIWLHDTLYLHDTIYLLQSTDTIVFISKNEIIVLPTNNDKVVITTGKDTIVYTTKNNSIHFRAGPISNDPIVLWKILGYGGGVALLGSSLYFLRNFLLRRRISTPKNKYVKSNDNPNIKKETIEEINGGDPYAKSKEYEGTSPAEETIKKGNGGDTYVKHEESQGASPDMVGGSTKTKADSNVGYQQGSAKGLTENEDAPRFLQSAIKDTNENYVLDQLAPDQDYKVEVRIGYEDKDFFVTEEQFDTSAVFADSTMDFEPIQIKFKSNLDDKVHFTEIKLPRQGNSESAYFNIHTKTTDEYFQGEFYAYHRGRLMQHVQLTLPVQKEKPASSLQRVKMKTIFCTRKNLSDISTRSAFSTSIEYEAGTKESSSLQGINKGQSVDLYFENGLKEHLMDMKLAIENALIDIKNHPANLLAKGNQELLLFLSLKGNLIHTNFIEGAIAPEGPIQIITNYQDYVPLEFVYNLPPPQENATLCEHAIVALKAGTCKGCFNHKEDPAPYICPFGFWSFSRIVERHSYQKRKNDQNADYLLVSEPTGKRTPLPVLQNAIYGSSQRVETTETLGIRQEIARGIKRNTQHFFEADDWENWEKVTRENSPDSLVLVVHIEKDKKFNIDKIEIGQDFVLQNYFRSQVIVNNDIETPPLIIIIGCESTNLATSGFDVSSHLMNAGAAIVISNFTKIRGRQAKDIVIKLFDFLKENGNKEIILGEIMLKLRQYLLAEGLMAGLSLVVQGDADWNIKS